MPQALVCAGCRGRGCKADDRRLPDEKHQVPPRAQASPVSVAMSPEWPTICGQNKSSKPDKPSAPPPNTCGAIRRPWMIRASRAFHKVEVEKTTAINPLGMVPLAL